MSALQNVFCAGSAAVCTVTVVHPIDTIKTRLQVSGTAGARNYAALGMMGTIKTVAAEEGIAAFWKGIPAAWLREGSYTSLRLGLYKVRIRMCVKCKSSARKDPSGKSRSKMPPPAPHPLPP